MFEIVGDDIAALNDTDLRALIGRLCEAELRRQSLPTTAVTWGGNQTARDGGLDVRVALPDGSAINGNIPKAQTGLQVKKPDMPRAEIIKEMKPEGTLRPVLLDLADANGAYIIVSSTGSTADGPLRERRKAMADAVKGTPAEGKITFDFFDRNRVATWVRDHAGLIPWVRAHIGRAVPGWQSFQSWSHVPEGAESTYLTDDRARIRTGIKDDGDGVSVLEGVKRIRTLLSSPGSVVRLVGLSGVGKTRLAEALFDPNFGEAALDSSLAIYTDVPDEPNPPPKGLASDLNASKTRAILVVDNCSPELHRQLSEVALAKGTHISVLTIEYDIKEDQPEGTDVFVLEVSSPELIEKLVSQRYPNLSQIDARTIAEFSGGNARIALALSSMIEKTETVAGLNHEELFKRLFQQRNEPDSSLLSIGQACSLVYSFEGETLEGEDAELPVLGSLVVKSPDEVYAAVAELRRRELVQERGPWRAVLPHAIANRLAKLALQNIPPTKVKSLLIEGSSDRLLRSFSRRLGYLDDSKEARAIVSDWLAPGGQLGNVTNLTELSRAMFANVAPVAPEGVLSALEKALAHADDATLDENSHFVPLLRSLAYDQAFFERAITLLVRFAALSGSAQRNDEFVNVVVSLFYIALSGTYAPIEMRIETVDRFLSSNNETVQAIGVKALAALMKTSHFTSYYEFNFGARSRDYGYYPQTGEEAQNWYGLAIELASKFALSNYPIAADVQKTVAGALRGLWGNSGQIEKLDQLSRAIAAKGFWREGWIATRQALTYEGSVMSEEDRALLISLAEFLRPKDLVDQVRGAVMNIHGAGFTLDELDDDELVDRESDETPDRSKTFEKRSARAAATRRRLGNEVARDIASFDRLLPELTIANGRIVEFGRALAETVEQPRELWDAMVGAISAIPSSNISLLQGFLNGMQPRDTVFTNSVLDAALEHQALSRHFPNLQAYAVLDEKAMARIHEALDLGIASIDAYYSLAYGQSSDDVPGPHVRDLVLHIIQIPGGARVALEIVAMRLISDDNSKRKPAAEILEAGRILLKEFEFSSKDDRNHRDDFELARVIYHSLKGKAGAPIAKAICSKFITAASNHSISPHEFGDLMQSLLKVQLGPTLDQLFSGDREAQAKSIRVINELTGHGTPTFNAVPEGELFRWIAKKPDERFPIVAAVVKLFERPKSDEPYKWRPVALRLLRDAPDARAVLREIVSRLRPRSWSGSLATKLESRLKLLQTLPIGDQDGLNEDFNRAVAGLKARVAEERQRESEENRWRDNRFE
ncbi:hypothetical protein [Rhizobium leguminosarum]|uniref:hypothetical protein n=1 Tax=Rhizobium leguminosarum TaxID=384 RepID=UPI00051C58B1|nr:hypothetical protein [Rhizobium leguminosarum]